MLNSAFLESQPTFLQISTGSMMAKFTAELTGFGFTWQTGCMWVCVRSLTVQFTLNSSTSEFPRAGTSDGTEKRGRRGSEPSSLLPALLG